MGKRTVVGQWLERKFLAWQSSTGERQSMAAFADYLRVSRAALNKWSSGERVPTGESLEVLGEKLGFDIYDLVGVPRPDMLLQVVIKNWGSLSDGVKAQISEIVRNRAGRTAGTDNSDVGPPERSR